MTNREWLLSKMQNMSDEELAVKINTMNGISEFVGCSEQENCTSRACERCIECWLKSEHKEKITLSEVERIILENIDKEYKWIARDKYDNELFIYTDKPIKNENNNWGSEGENADLELFRHLFNFITWNDSEPYNIEELLKGE